MEQLILVTGGTGTLGRAVVDTLRSRGRAVRILSRRPGTTAETVVGDLNENTGLEAAVAGVGTIIHCATDGRTDVQSTRNLIAAAAKAGTPHLVYISIVGVDRHPLFYYRAKYQVELLIEHAGLPWTILRATQFHSLVAGLFRAQRWLPLLFAPKFSFQPIEVAEVAERLAEIAVAAPASRVDDIGGPEILTCRDLAATYLAATDSRRRVVPLRLPGKVFSAYAAGHHLAPEHRFGRRTFAEFMAAGQHRGH